MATEFFGTIAERDQEDIQAATDTAKQLSETLAPSVSVVQEEPEKSVFSLVPDIMEEDFAIPSLLRAVDRENPEIDPDFIRTPEMYKEAMNVHGIMPDHLDELDDSVSIDDWNAKIQHIKEEQDITAELSQYGWKGAAVRIGTNILDPATWALALATGGLGLAGKAAQIGKVAYTTRLAGLTAAETAAIEAAILSDKVTWEVEDTIAAVGTAGVLGGGIGALSRSTRGSEAAQNAINRYSDDAQKESVLNAIDKTGIKISDEARAALTPEKLQTAPSAFAGVLRTPTIFGLDNRIGIRYDMMSRVKTSLSPVLSKYFSRLGQDALADVGDADTVGAVNKISATEMATRIHRSKRDIFSQIVAQRNKFANAEGLPGYAFFRRNEVYQNFYELVERAVRREGDSFIDTEIQGLLPEQRAALKAARDFYRASTRKMLKDLKDAGIDAADDIDFNDFYVPRRIKSSVINNWTRTLGEDTLIDLIANSYLKGTRGRLTEKEARTLAKSYVLGIRRIADDNVVNFGRVSSRNIDELEHYLRASGIDDKILADARAILEKRQKAGSNLSARGRTVSTEDAGEFRADIDELYEEVVTDLNGNQFTFRMEDLFESNVMLYDQYLQMMSGRIAAAKVLDIRSDKDFRDRIEEIEADIQTLSDADQVSARSDLDRVDIMYRHLMGKSLRADESNPTRNFLARLLMGYNYTLYMGQVGFAQVAELGNINAFFGTKAMYKQMPALRALKRDLETGEIVEDQVMREIEAICGIGSEFHRFSTYSERYTGTAGEVLGQQFSPGQQRVLGGLEKLKQATSVISGMTPITIWMQRLASKAAVQNIYDKAKRGFTPEDYRNFREMSLDKETADKLGDQLKKATVNERGVVLSTGLDNWDPQLREDFANMLSRLTYRVIQENDIGTMGMFMTSNVGKILTQFRTFMLVSWPKQTLHMAHRKDMMTFNAFMATTFLGGLAYLAQTGIKGLTADDLTGEDGKWELENISKAAFQRSAYSSLFPGLIDTGLYLSGFDPQFSYGRSTGLATGLIDGSPTYQALSRIENILGLPGVINPASDREANWEKVAKSLPFSNAVGIHNLIQYLFGDD